MGVIDDFCADLGENARRILSGEDLNSVAGQRLSLYDVCLGHLAGLKEKDRDLYAACEREFVGGSIQHHSRLIGDHEGHFVYLMFWMPGAFTRPHNHMGSPARIQVLNPNGVLERSHYDVGETKGDVTPHVLGNCVEGEDIEEDAQDIHAVRNPTSSTITISLHDFLGNAGTSAHDFERNLKWQTPPGGSSRPGIPYDIATPIW